MTMPPGPASVRIFFSLEQDEDGYPPAAVESVWAEAREEGAYRIDNAPFFARSATVGDIVSCRIDEEGRLWFSHVLEHSRHSLIRALLAPTTPYLPVQEQLAARGAWCEWLDHYRILAIDVTTPSALPAVQAYLQEESEAGTLEYEEPILFD